MAKGKGQIGSLRVLLSLNSAAFDTAIKKTRRTLRRWNKQFGAIIGRVAKFGAALGTAAVAIGTVFVRQAMKSIDETAKWADRIGIATEKLTALEHAAAITGVTARQLRTGLQRMTRRISEASVGTGEARGVLAELGLEINKLNRMSPDKQFMAIANAMQRTKFSGDRVRQTVKIFDMEAAGLVNTLRLGTEGLDRMQREALRLGISFKRVDAAQIEAANDAITRLRQVFRGAWNVLTIQLAPMITYIADRFTAAGLAGKGMGEQVRDGFYVALIAVGKVADAVEWIIRRFAGLAAAVNNLADMILWVMVKIDDLTKDLPGGGGGKTGEVLRRARESIKGNYEYWKGLSEQTGPKASERLFGFAARTETVPIARTLGTIQSGIARGRPPTAEQIERLIALQERAVRTMGALGLLG